MRRWTFRVAVLLTAFFLVTWKISYSKGLIYRPSADSGVQYVVNNGEIIYWWYNLTNGTGAERYEVFDPQVEPMTAKIIAQELKGGFTFEHLGIYFGRFTTALGRCQHTVLVLPYWLFCVIPGAVAAAKFRLDRTKGRGFPVMAKQSESYGRARVTCCHIKLLLENRRAVDATSFPADIHPLVFELARGKELASA